ncbi:MAG: autotransporter assembly complex protein TamA [Gemmatimonas sp.]|uniref:autotransporter assembly complex protein TamA n=1 Tax=Gemmatimonas sp. TaxID=1962908 RepID=UPI00391F1092
MLGSAPVLVRYRYVVLLLSVVLAATRAGAQRATRCDASERIRRVHVQGSPAFDALTLSASIVTHEPGVVTRLFRMGRAPCVDSLEVRRDALRLAVLHRQAGWFQAAVTPRIERKPHGVTVVFVIAPGPEAVLDTVRISGLPAAAPGGRPYAEALYALEGERFDRTRLDTTLAAVVTRLRDASYARAGMPQSRVVIDSATGQVTLDLAFAPGPSMRIGSVAIDIRPLRAGDPQVRRAEVVRLVAIDSGDRFRASAMLDAQRALYRSEAFRLVVIDTVTRAGAARDSVLDLRFAVAEARTRSARAGLGWATQDCIRAQGRITDRGFLGVGRRVELSVRASKLGVGAPTDFAPALCSGALRQDPFSERLNYYVGATLSNSRFFGLPLAPAVSLYSERRGEPFAYLRETTIGALAEVSRQFTPRTTGTAGFQYENGRTDTDPVVSCTRFGQCRPEEVILSLFGRGVGILSTSGTYDRTNDVANPSRGFRVRGEVRAGATYSELVSSLRFYRSTGEVATFGRAFGGVIGARLQAAGAFAPGAELVGGTPLLPQQERLFVGGQNSVRGYQQNLLGPIVYVVSNVREFTNDAGDREVEVVPGAGFTRAVPRGGTALLVGNLEWRRPMRFLSEQVQVAAFIDAGTLWETSSDRFRWSDLRATPGVGLRVITPLGPFRVDMGYRPYGLRSGPALYFSPASSDGGSTIFCASPRTTRLEADFGDVINCPSTFAPPSARGVLSRIVFHFGLGQAF